MFHSLHFVNKNNNNNNKIIWSLITEEGSLNFLSFEKITLNEI